MSDHKSKQRTVGVRELKARAASILRHVREERAPYTITLRGRDVAVLLPADAAGDMANERGGDAWSAFMTAGRSVERAFKAGQSGVQELSSSRR